jgi:hypothetical protein
LEDAKSGVKAENDNAFWAATGNIPPPDLTTPSHFCPFCDYYADEIGVLQDHISDTHPIDRPCLLQNGQECQADHVVRRHSVFASINATSATICVDGTRERAIKPAAVGPHLTNSKQVRAAPVSSSYRLVFRITDTSVLQEVEAAFLEHIVEQRLSMDTVRGFLDDRRCKGPGADYADGLAKYVTGLLVKERPDGQHLTSPLERYRELFGLSLQSLSALSRPLSTLVCAIIRFSMNDTSEFGNDTGFLELDIAARMLTGPSYRPLAVYDTTDIDSISRRRVCPIDHATGRVLDLAVRMARQTRWSQTLSEECRQVAESASLDNVDRQKALALWAVTALRLGTSEAALDPLAQLSATYPFSTWAGPCLEKVSKS